MIIYIIFLVALLPVILLVFLEAAALVFQFVIYALGILSAGYLGWWLIKGITYMIITIFNKESKGKHHKKG